MNENFFNTDDMITFEKLNKFFEFCVKVSTFPFSKNELLDLMDRYDKINLNNDDPKSYAEEIYLFNEGFLNKINSYITK